MTKILIQFYCAYRGLAEVIIQPRLHRTADDAAKTAVALARDKFNAKWPGVNVRGEISVTGVTDGNVFLNTKGEPQRYVKEMADLLAAHRG